MKRRLYLILALLISPPLMSASGGGSGLRGSILTPFFQALKTGNTAAIEALIGGDLLKETKVLLRQNKAYPQFLRDYYQGATFEVSQVSAEKGKAAAKITVVFPGGGRQHFWLHLTRQPKKGQVRPNKQPERSRLRLTKQPEAVQWRIVGSQSRE